MKISKLFHWLYASVMMLPLVVAPIYAIFMHRHNVTNYEVTTGGYEVTEKYQTNEVNTLDDLVSNNVYHFDEFPIIQDDSTYDIAFYILNYSSLEIYGSVDDSYIDSISFDLYNSLDGNYLYTYCIFGGSLNSIGFNFTNSDSYISYWYDFLQEDNDVGSTLCLFTDVDLYVDDTFLADFVTYYQWLVTYSDYSLPTASTFQSFDYQYNEGLIYSDTDIGSQFIYSIYLPLNKYFNVTSFLGLNNLYSWINTNVFNGVAPLGFNIFYMLLSYWLLVSIFWLVFDVVMYVPNLAHRWLDKASLD